MGDLYWEREGFRRGNRRFESGKVRGLRKLKREDDVAAAVATVDSIGGGG